MTRKTSGLPTVVLNLVGLALLVAGWAAVSSRVTLSEQAPYLNLAVGGILIAGIGNALYIMTLRRTVETRLSLVQNRIDSGVTGS